MTSSGEGVKVTTGGSRTPTSGGAKADHRVGWFGRWPMGLPFRLRPRRCNPYALLLALYAALEGWGVLLGVMGGAW